MNFFAFILVTCYLLLVAPSAAVATVIDLSPQPVFGETIEIQKEASRSSIFDDISSIILGGFEKIGPKTETLPFPKFGNEESFFSNKELQSRALPAEFISQLQFEATESVKKKLDNKKPVLTHVGCGKVEAAGQSGIDTLTQPSQTTFSASGEYGQLLLHSRFWQSIFVPDQGSDLNFKTSEPSDPNIPQHFVDCLTSNGVSGDVIQTQYSGPAPLSFADSVIQDIKKILLGILPSLGQKTDVKIKVQQVKYLPGETQFENQTVGEDGFLNFFKPHEVPFSQEGDQKEVVDYEVSGKTEKKGINYSGASSFQGGTEDLRRSLYPAEFLPPQ